MGELSGERSGSRKSLKRLARREVAALSLAGLVLLLATAAALAVTGALTQPAGTAGCVSETGTGPCADGHGLRYPDSVAVSADGKSVYAASDLSRAALKSTRPPDSTAARRPAGCISQTRGRASTDGRDRSAASAPTGRARPRYQRRWRVLTGHDHWDQARDRQPSA
jgi:hypothetical protein